MSMKNFVVVSNKMTEIWLLVNFEVGKIAVVVIDTHVHITPNHCYIIRPTVHVLVHSYCLRIPIGFSNLAIKAILTPYCHIPQRYPPWTCFKVISLFSQKFNKHCCLLINMLHFNGTNSCWDNRL